MAASADAENLVVPEDGVEAEGNVLLQLEADEVELGLAAGEGEVEGVEEEDGAREADGDASCAEAVLLLEPLERLPDGAVAIGDFGAIRIALDAEDVRLKDLDAVAFGRIRICFLRRRMRCRGPRLSWR